MTKILNINVGGIDIDRNLNNTETCLREEIEMSPWQTERGDEQV